MDIKDFILIAGGLLIASVVAHGFWIAWQARRDPLRLDIARDFVSEDVEVDDIERLRGELPNGGARVKVQPQQTNLALDPPVLLEPTAKQGLDLDRELFGDPTQTKPGPDDAVSREEIETLSVEPPPPVRRKRRPSPQEQLNRERAKDMFEHRSPRVAEVDLPPEVSEPTHLMDAPQQEAPKKKEIASSKKITKQQTPKNTKVASPKKAVKPGVKLDTQQDDAPRTSQPNTSVKKALDEPTLGNPVPTVGNSTTAMRGRPVAKEAGAKDSLRKDKPQVEAESTVPAAPRGRTLGGRSRPTHEPRRIGGQRSGQAAANLDKADRNALQKPTQKAAEVDTTVTAEVPEVDEVFVFYVLAPTHMAFAGSAVFDALRNQGLRYGAMKIFHRVDTLTKANLFSVANAVEPGVFENPDSEEFATPGLTFFMQLPGPDEPLQSFNDLMDVAKAVAVALGGELKDQQMNPVTNQTVQHYQQRVADATRRRLTQRA